MSERARSGSSSVSGVQRALPRHEQKTLISTEEDERRLVAPPLERDRVVLVRMDPANEGSVVSADAPEFFVGRSPENQLVLDDTGISRSHAKFYHSGGRFFVADLGSSNGTFVNGRRVTKSEIGDGTTVQLGPRVCFRFTIVDRQQERLLRQLYESSVRDALTGAHNRQYFSDRLDAEVAYAARHGTNTSLLIFDIDHFKRVNDTYGHLAGDSVLRAVAEKVTKAMRTEDLFARYGGEEFVALLRGVPLSGATKAAERLRRVVADTPIEHEMGAIFVTVSVGCAALTCCARPSGRELLAVADRRLYAAKNAGRNRVAAAG